MEFINGVKRKQQNPTNWQFSDHPACMAEELAQYRVMDAEEKELEILISKLGGRNVAGNS